MRTRRKRIVAAAATAAAAIGAAATAGQAGAAITITGSDADVWNAAEPPPTYVITTTAVNRRITWSVPGVGSGQGASPLTVVLDPVPDGTYRLEARETGLFPATGARTFLVDRTPPTVAIRQPLHGTVVDQGAALLADYACDGAASCTGTVPPGAPLDTSRPGVWSLRVDAADAAGNTASAVAEYQVLAPGAPAATTPPAPPRAPRLVLPRTIGAARMVPRVHAAVATRRPVLRWPARRGARLYNVQVFRLRPGRQPQKIASLFPRASRVRVPPRRLADGGRYAWRVWPFVRGGYTAKPLGLSIFRVDLSRARARARR